MHYKAISHGLKRAEISFTFETHVFKISLILLMNKNVLVGIKYFLP